MNMMVHPSQSATALMSRASLPAWMTAPAGEDRPTLAWHIDATTGRAVAGWILLPKRTTRL